MLVRYGALHLFLFQIYTVLIYHLTFFCPIILQYTSSTPCPYGDASGVCPSGMKCIAGTPCDAMINNEVTITLEVREQEGALDIHIHS